MILHQCLTASKGNDFLICRNGRTKWLTISERRQIRLASFCKLGYFRAADRFFNIQDFNPRDIELIAGRMSIVLDEIQWTEYSYTSYERHQEIILNRFGFVRFNEAAKQLLAKESLSLCSNQMKPKSMFMSLVDFLREKKSRTLLLCNCENYYRFFAAI